MAFRLDGRERLISLGAYDDVSLAEARDARDAKRKLIAKGTGPVAKKRAEAAE